MAGQDRSCIGNVGDVPFEVIEVGDVYNQWIERRTVFDLKYFGDGRDVRITSGTGGRDAAGTCRLEACATVDELQLVHSRSRFFAGCALIGGVEIQ